MINPTSKRTTYCALRPSTIASAAGKESCTCNGRASAGPHAAHITVSTPAPSRKCDMAALCGSSYFRIS